MSAVEMPAVSTHELANPIDDLMANFMHLPGPLRGTFFLPPREDSFIVYSGMMPHDGMFLPGLTYLHTHFEHFYAAIMFQGDVDELGFEYLPRKPWVPVLTHDVFESNQKLISHAVQALQERIICNFSRKSASMAMNCRNWTIKAGSVVSQISCFTAPPDWFSMHAFWILYYRSNHTWNSGDTLTYLLANHSFSELPPRNSLNSSLLSSASYCTARPFLVAFIIAYATLKSRRAKRLL